MVAARKMKTGDELVAEAAKRALEDAGGDMQKAAQMLEDGVRQSPKLRDALTEPLISSACYDAVRKQVQFKRREVWTGSKSRTAGNSAPEAIQRQTARVVQLATGTLAMFPLPGGKPLGQASREEIATAAEFYARQSADMGAKARWLRLIGQSVPEGKTVSDVLTDERLRELQMEAQRGE